MAIKVSLDEFLNDLKQGPNYHVNLSRLTTFSAVKHCIECQKPMVDVDILERGIIERYGSDSDKKLHYLYEHIIDNGFLVRHDYYTDRCIPHGEKFYMAQEK